jgi:hypothetical protein
MWQQWVVRNRGSASVFSLATLSVTCHVRAEAECIEWADAAASEGEITCFRKQLISGYSADALDFKQHGIEAQIPRVKPVVERVIKIAH